jgi:hypothetical protein
VKSHVGAFVHMPPGIWSFQAELNFITHCSLWNDRKHLMKITCQDHNHLTLKRLVIPQVLKSSVECLQHCLCDMLCTHPNDSLTFFQNLSLPVPLLMLQRGLSE